MSAPMLMPPKPWPYTGRKYPAQAKLCVANIHAKWADLLWVDASRNARVYLSTLPISTYKQMQRVEQ
jgi:hypothetical protein